MDTFSSILDTFTPEVSQPSDEEFSPVNTEYPSLGGQSGFCVIA
ncbi:fungal mating-type pheromone [Serpula lacrymans var. lacrymans S7.3]|uniref:Fungal mating-type pheromone n=1 Tax=Serpula lacrymans var. lacrymans (strain S7.3) TaxID=936435 RepID=F8QGC7_SERL3|nr:fungal mating-type pheromone [Serpula lacrymans var. lacrymans S7.3]